MAKFNLNQMPDVKVADTDTEDKSEAFDSAKEKTNSKYLYDTKNGRKVSKKEAYKPNGEIKDQYKSFVTDTIAGKKVGSGSKAKKVVEDVKDAIKNGQERNAVRADYSEASPDVKESLAKNTKASQKVIDKQVESIKNGEGFEGSKKVLTDTAEGKAMTSGQEIEESKPEDNFKQVEAITSDPNVEKAIADTGLSIDSAPEDPSLAGEVASNELQKAGLDKDTVNSLMSAFAGAFTGNVDKEKDVKSELASVLANKKEQLDELSKTGMGSKIAGILTVLSAVACLATGGVIPPINFNTISAIITDPHGYIRGNKEHAIEEKRKDIESANEAVREAEKKDITYKTDKDLVKQIMAENPGMTEEDAWQMLKDRTRQSVNVSAEQVSKDADLARDFVSRNFTTGDDARAQAQQYREQALKYRQAIRELSTANIDKQVELMQSLVPTLGQLDTSINSAGSSSGKSIQGGAEAGKLTKFLIEPKISGGLSFSNEASSTNTRMSREGVNKANDLYKQYLTSSSDATKQFKEALEDAANKCEALAAEYEKAANSTNEQFSADKVTSDIRKKLMKHTYIPKEKRLH